MKSGIRLAVPNKGRLKEPTARLLRESGLSYELSDRTLAAPARNADVEILFVKAEDVCELVADEAADLGITGLDLAAESGLVLDIITELGYGHCRLTAAVPTGSPIKSIEDFFGLRVATAHPSVTKRYFAERGIEITTVPLRGSIEVAPKLGIADVVVDLVSSGSTMLVNGLRQVSTLLESEAALVSRPGAQKEEAIARFATMARAVVAARGKKYILMNASESSLSELSQIIPGLEAPTIMPLTEKGWVSIQSVVDADDVWTVLPRLKRAGASGILVLPIQQLIT